MDTCTVTWKMQHNTTYCGKCHILLNIMCFEILNTFISFQEIKLDPLFEMRSSFEGRLHQVHVYIEVLIVSRHSVGGLDNTCLGGEWNLIFQKLVKPQNLKFIRYKSLPVYIEFNLHYYVVLNVGNEVTGIPWVAFTVDDVFLLIIISNCISQNYKPPIHI
jgi:hypothetical protein